MQNLGIGKVSALLGGYPAWQAEGKPVVKGDKPK
jgi:3-mercaptopyruvate sulfurtransferase SseA